jgi:DNA-binding response OmpR family regulator
MTAGERQHAAGILLVGSQPLIAQYLELVLRRAAYTQVRRLANLDQLDVVCREFCPDLIVCDLGLDKPVSMAVVAGLGQLNGPAQPAILVLACAPLDHAQRQALALETAVGRSLSRPFYREGLLEAVAEALRAQAGGRRAG